MIRRLLVVIATFGLLAAASASSATVIVYTTTLSGLNEVPASGSSSTGSSTISFDTLTQMLTVDVVFSGLSAPATAAHIHCCTAAGSNIGVALALVGFPAASSGTYNHLFELSNAAVYSGTFVANNGGTASGAEAALLNGLGNNLAYVNIHTSIHPGGEIRGQVAAARVPEPATLALLGMGMGMAGLALSRRRNASATRAAARY